MPPLTINDIRIWLVENRNDFKKLKAEEYLSFDNPLLFLYPQFYELMKYYSLCYKCKEALSNLRIIMNKDFTKIANWTKQYEILGSQNLLMFEIDYFDWVDEAEDGLLKIKDGLHIEKPPFENILCSCKIFQIAYWNNNFHEEQFTDKELLTIKQEVLDILNNHSRN